MFSSSIFRFLKFFSFIIITTFIFSCKDEIALSFSETAIIDEDETVIEINIPKAEGKSKAANQINKTLTSFVTSALNIDAVATSKADTKESILAFKKAYKDFKIQIGKTLFTNLPPWEVIIDGEVIYKSETLVTVAMNSSINTGGAHSNLIFKFYNFDAKTGKQLETNDLINDIPAFTALAQKFYNKEILSANQDRIDAFKTDTFKLPKNLGFSDDGIIVFFDTFNSSVNNVIEFTIPFTLANQYLNF